MDGLKERLNASVRYRLSFALTATIVAVALVAGIFSFLSAFDEAHDLQDDVLQQVASLVDQQRLTWASGADSPRVEDAVDDTAIAIQVLGDGGKFAGKLHDGGALSLPDGLADGLHTLMVAGESYRVLVRTVASGARIAISQEADARNEMAYNSALRTLLPFLVLVPVLLIIIAQLIRKMFRPITDLSSQIDARAENDLEPIRDGYLPSEVQPFVRAINRLLARVAESISVQRRFVADAAHELRSPLTALSLQAQRMEHLEMSSAARDRLRILQKGIERGRNLLSQLLSLSKVQASADSPVEAVSVLGVYRAVLEELMPMAKARHMDLGVLEGPDALIRASELDLFTLVRNLVDNAIRYTPEGGRVDLSVQDMDTVVIMRVADTGPGIPPQERERVFDPFYRILGNDTLGSGLGLAIVATIAHRMGAQVSLDDADLHARSGLAVTVRVPVCQRH